MPAVPSSSEYPTLTPWRQLAPEVFARPDEQSKDIVSRAATPTTQGGGFHPLWVGQIPRPRSMRRIVREPQNHVRSPRRVAESCNELPTVSRRERDGAMTRNTRPTRVGRVLPPHWELGAELCADERSVRGVAGHEFLVLAAASGAGIAKNDEHR